MVDSTLYDTTVQTEGTLQLAHERIIRVKRAGIFENISGDANNLAPVPTPVTVARENYGNKGRSSIQKVGDNWVITCDFEAVRDNNGAIAQPWLLALLNAAKAKGAANLVEIQVFDAKDPALGATQGSYSVTVADLKTGYAESGGYKFTFTSNGIVADIESPIAGSGLPTLESALPTAKAAGQNVVVKGYGIGALVSATVGAVPVTSITQISGSDNVVVLELPAGTAGSAPIVVTNEAGDSTALPYTRGA